VIKWPENSLDFNPIVNKNTVSIPQLRELTLMIWVSDISLDYRRQLVMYMPGRIQKVMGLKRDMTKYRNILFCVHKVLHLWFLIFLLFY
jgi:hypothetical protein